MSPPKAESKRPTSWDVDLGAGCYSEEHDLTVGDRINGLHWHETYHTGQLEIMRQLAGTNDRIVG